MDTHLTVLAAMQRLFRQTIYWALQPVLIVLSLYLAYVYASVNTHTQFVILALGVITVLETCVPARPEWRKSVKENLALLGFVCLAGVAYIGIETLYEMSLFSWMTDLSRQWNLGVWPTQWPILIQVLLIFAAYELVNYWYHRASHRWNWLWKLSGHNTHHAFKKLSGLNAVANHPIEAFFLILPRAIVGFLFGGEDVGAAFVSLTSVTAMLAHSNLNLNSFIIGWFFTTNRYHIHHHSQVMAQSNTNYGCVCIIWDRIFGTFQDADTKDTGIGDTQPSYRSMLAMPFKR